VPLIYCPSCRRITYAVEVYDEFDEVVGYRCGVCGNAFRCDQVNVVEFPEVSFVLRGSFVDFIAEVEGVSEDTLLETLSPKEIAMRFWECLKRVAREEKGREIRPCLDRFGRPAIVFAWWNYVGDRDGELHNGCMEEYAMEVLGSAVDAGCVSVEIREMDEGDSLYVAVLPEDVAVIKDVLRRYGFLP